MADANGQIFNELLFAVAGSRKAVHTVGRLADLGAGAGQITDALTTVSHQAARLLETARRARELEPIPDPETHRGLDDGLRRWIEAAETLALAAAQRDVPGVRCGIRALDLGTEPVLRATVRLLARDRSVT